MTLGTWYKYRQTEPLPIDCFESHTPFFVPVCPCAVCPAARTYAGMWKAGHANDVLVNELSIDCTKKWLLRKGFWRCARSLLWVFLLRRKNTFPMFISGCCISQTLPYGSFNIKLRGQSMLLLFALFRPFLLFLFFCFLSRILCKVYFFFLKLWFCLAYLVMWQIHSLS